MIDTLTLINQGFTVALLVLIWALFLEWWPGSKRALTALIDHNKRPSRPEWVMLAIMLSHIGFFLDNLYWLVSWSGVYLDVSFGPFLRDNGVYANSVFRQGIGILSVYLHIYAARYIRKDPGGTGREIRSTMYWSLGLGGVFTFLLFILGIWTHATS